MYNLLLPNHVAWCYYSLGRRTYALAAELIESGAAPLVELKRSKRASAARHSTTAASPAASLDTTSASPAAALSTADSGSGLDTPAPKFSTGIRMDLHGCGARAVAERLLEVPTPELRRAAKARMTSHPKDVRWLQGSQGQNRKQVASRLFRAAKGRWAKELKSPSKDVGRSSDADAGDDEPDETDEPEAEGGSVEDANDPTWHEQKGASQKRKRKRRRHGAAVPAS